jgi:adenine phosphoribosyltransferase
MTDGAVGARIRALVRDVPDFPKPGILFRDITPVLAEPGLVEAITEQFVRTWVSAAIDVVAGIESRGFLFGTPLAMALGVGFVPIRKPGKLPWRTEHVDYALEYGTDALEIHSDAIRPGQRVLVIDDLLATGGTAAAAVRLVERLHGAAVGAAFVLELGFLDGRARLPDVRVDALARFD